MDIVTELRRRQRAVEELLKRRGLDAALFVGNSAVGPQAYGCFRYLTDHRVYYHLQALVLRPDMAPAICCGSVLHLDGVHNKGFEDVRLGPDILGSVCGILSERPILRLGWTPDTVPALWYDRLRAEFPQMELVDVTDDVFELRSVHSEYEVECIRKCARIADAGYKAVCDMAKPGVRMSDLHAELDYAMKAAGAEETFTLMSNGRFSYDNNGLPCIRAFSWPDDRVIAPGDNIGMEITPRYKGYWTQMVRTVCISEGNPELERAHALQLELIDSTVKMLRPGVALGDVLKHMWHETEKVGLIPRLPFGHIVGLDLDEGGRGSLESTLVLKKNANVVLHPTMVKGDMNYSIFWGDPYLVTEQGGVRINESSTELLTLRREGTACSASREGPAVSRLFRS